MKTKFVGNSMVKVFEVVECLINHQRLTSLQNSRCTYVYEFFPHSSGGIYGILANKGFL